MLGRIAWDPAARGGSSLSVGGLIRFGGYEQVPYHPAHQVDPVPGRVEQLSDGARRVDDALRSLRNHRVTVPTTPWRSC